MKLSQKRRELQGPVGGIAVVAAIAGFVGGVFTPKMTIVITAGIVIIGVTLVNVFTDAP